MRFDWWGWVKEEYTEPKAEWVCHHYLLLRNTMVTSFVFPQFLLLNDFIIYPLFLDF